jgi:hypothetical protein
MTTGIDAIDEKIRLQNLPKKGKLPMGKLVMK